ncbi:hypothetical protein [Pantoea sp. B65]|uniref:hypothetical protein n=1 Tax=Pantoea sp. B65 TaxID=2813359 RepID=UPI0039B689FB
MPTDMAPAASPVLFRCFTGARAGFTGGMAPYGECSDCFAAIFSAINLLAALLLPDAEAYKQNFFLQ